MLFDSFKNRKSFTLIELLVVIAVIGLLASIVIVNLSGARSKANIAKGLQFGQSVYHALGSEAVGVWNFDEGSGTTANDASGYNNHGTLTNGPVWRCISTDSNYTPSGQGCSIQFDGADDYVACPAIAISANLTISLWYKRTGAMNTYVPLVEQGGARRYRLILYNGRPKFGWNSVQDDLFGTNNQYYTIGKWYYLVATYDGNPHIYINGEEIIPLIQLIGHYGSWDSSQLRIGYRPYTTLVGPFNGLIDEVRIYEKALETAQIETMYYAGLERLLAEYKITEEEYRERLALR